MDVEQLRAYFLSKNGATEGFPFDADTLVFKVMGKMFGLIPLERMPPQVNLKCTPAEAMVLREAYPDAIFPGYHMSKTHWNTLHLEALSPQFIKTQVDISYALVVAKLTKKDRLTLEAKGNAQ